MKELRKVKGKVGKGKVKSGKGKDKSKKGGKEKRWKVGKMERCKDGNEKNKQSNLIFTRKEKKIIEEYIKEKRVSKGKKEKKITT